MKTIAAETPTTTTVETLTKQIDAANAQIQNARSKLDVERGRMKNLEGQYQKTLLEPDGKDAHSNALEIQISGDRITALQSLIARTEREIQPFVQERSRLIELEMQAREAQEVLKLTERSKAGAEKAIEQISAGLKTLAQIQRPLREFQSVHFPAKSRTVSAARKMDQELFAVLETAMRNMQERQRVADAHLEPLYEKHVHNLMRSAS